MRSAQAFLSSLASVLGVVAGISALVSDAHLRPSLYWIGIAGIWTFVALAGLDMVGDALEDALGVDWPDWAFVVAAVVLGLGVTLASIAYDPSAGGEATGGFNVGHFFGLVVLACVAALLCAARDRPSSGAASVE